MTSPIPLPHGHGDAASDQFTKQLGRLVLASTHLEATSAALAEGMGVDPSGASIPTVLVRVERRAEAGMPPWAPVRSDDLTRWCEYARRLLDDRDRLYAALPAHRFTGSDGDAPRMESADGSVVPADERYLDRMITRIHRHDTIGTDLRMRLDYVDQRGMTWPLGLWRIERADGDPEDASFESRVAQLPAEWRAWLEWEGDGAAEEDAVAPIGVAPASGVRDLDSRASG